MIEIHKVSFSGAIWMHPGKILKVGYQDGELMFWYEANLHSEKTLRKFQAVPTGAKPPNPKLSRFIDTVFQRNGCVWHIYEVA